MSAAHNPSTAPRMICLRGIRPTAATLFGIHRRSKIVSDADTGLFFFPTGSEETPSASARSDDPHDQLLEVVLKPDSYSALHKEIREGKAWSENALATFLGCTTVCFHPLSPEQDDIPGPYQTQ